MKEMIMWDKYDNKYREVVDVEVARGLEADLYEANNRITDLLDMVKQKDELINLMAEEFINKTLMYNDWQKNDLIEYFEKRCKDAKD